MIYRTIPRTIPCSGNCTLIPRVQLKLKLKFVYLNWATSCFYCEISLTSSFLLYMPVFAALAGGKVPLYRPLGAPVNWLYVTRASMTALGLKPSGSQMPLFHKANFVL
jgi:hypothetical protein